MTYDQIAAAVGASAATVHRDIRLARAWLLNELDAGRSK
jgi:DNA-directed RNA polymerase specialized sigma24 family protein